MLKSDIEYYALNLRVGDEYKEGIVFSCSDKEISVFKRFKNSKYRAPNSVYYTFSNYDSLKSLEDRFWKIPNKDLVNTFVQFSHNNNIFLPFNKRIWTSDIVDFISVNCIELNESNDNVKTSEIISGKSLMLYGILVHTIELKS